MSENMMFGLYRSQLAALKETVEAWKADHQDAMAARDVEDMIRHSAEAPAAVAPLAGGSGTLQRRWLL